jgi:50S ribosomal protein L16 3-hydroxylase
MAGPPAHDRTRAPAAPLGGLAAAAFLRRHWHKEPLLVRVAMAGFTGLFSAPELFALARRDDVESRLVVRDGAHWSLAHGPFRRADFKSLPARHWTLLVQGVNLVDPAGDALLRRFSFLPFARLDDLMVSYAAPGGGVGPHFDSYDVFLLQGFGRRRWRYGRQDSHELRPRLPLQILRRFVPTHDAVLAPGDMLYLPPHYAHDGVAIDACTTYSIGFRAAGATELAAAFLDFLRDELDLPGRYADPDLAPVRAPAEIGPAMRRRCALLLDGIAWDPTTVARFLGCWLSEPKPQVFFLPPRPALTPAAFRNRMAKHGLRLDPRTQLLYDPAHLFINGVALGWPAGGGAALRQLANSRSLAARLAGSIPPETARILYNWYRDGYLHTNTV